MVGVGCWLALSGCGARSALEVDQVPEDEARAGGPSQPAPTVTPKPTPTPTPTPSPALLCQNTGTCASTKKLYGGDLGGLEGADRLCQAEFPGSHFYRQSCDSGRNMSAFGYAELELGQCWSCNGWTSNDSGAYRPETVMCPTGYATVGGVIPYSACLDPSGNGNCWRICEAFDKPLVCCWPYTN